MKKERKRVEILEGSMWDKILLFALPLAAGSVLQQLFNAVDLAVVGRFSGSTAMAAVGSCSSMVNLLVNLFVGLSVGANVVIAREVGAGHKKEIPKVVHSALMIAIVGGLFLILVGQVLARRVLTLMACPEDVIDLAVLYIKIYFTGMPFFLLYNFGAAILRSVGDSKRPLYCLIFSGFLNAVLNVIFVVGFGRSVDGVAVATVLSNVAGAFLVLRILSKEEEMIRFVPKQLRFHRRAVLDIMRIGVPSGLQGMVFSFSNVCIQSVINTFGSDVVAGSAAALNFEMLSYHCVNAFSQTAVTFSSQNFGAKKVERCKKAVLLCGSFAMIAAAIMDLFFYFGRVPILSLFTTSALVLEWACVRTSHVAVLQWLVVTYEITASGLRSIGYSLLPSLICIFGTCLFRIAYCRYALFAHEDFHFVVSVYPISWILTGTVMIGTYLFISRRVFEKLRCAA